MSPATGIVVALPAEARPLIDHFGLRRRHAVRAFPLYTGDPVALVVSGPGKVHAAAATALLHAAAGLPDDAAWLNAGIAGHPDLSVGDGFLAHRIIDAASGQAWYPPRLLDTAVASRTLTTVERPGGDAGPDTALDMEAAGFYPVACRFSTAELVQCYKIVSDNRAQPAERVTAALARELVEAHTDTIAELVERLARLRGRLGTDPADALIGPFLSSHRYSATERHRLRALLRRWRACAGDDPAWRPEYARLRRGAEVLAAMQRRIGEPGA